MKHPILIASTAVLLFTALACGPSDAHPTGPSSRNDPSQAALAAAGPHDLAFALQRSVQKRDALLAAAGIPHHQSGVVSVTPADGAAEQGYVVGLWARCVPRIEPCLEAFDFTAQAFFVTDSAGALIRLHAPTAEDLRVLLSFGNAVHERVRAALSMQPTDLLEVQRVEQQADGSFEVEVLPAGSGQEPAVPVTVTLDPALELVKNPSDN